MFEVNTTLIVQFINLLILILFLAGIIAGIIWPLRAYKNLKIRVSDLEKKISQIKIDEEK